MIPHTQSARILIVIGCCVWLVWSVARLGEAEPKARSQESSNAEFSGNAIDDSRPALSEPDRQDEFARRVAKTPVFTVSGRLVGCDHAKREALVMLRNSERSEVVSAISHGGQFSLGGITEGRWLLQVDGPEGHRADEVGIHVRDDIDFLTIHVHPFVSVEIGFRDEGGNRVSAGRIACQDHAPALDYYAVAQRWDSATDSNWASMRDQARGLGVENDVGRFTKSTGRLDVTAHLPVFVTAVAGRTPLETQRLVPGQSSIVFSLTDAVLQSACGGIRGRVVALDSGNGLQERTSVGIVDDPNSDFYLLQHTKENGSFLIQGVAAGHCTVLFEFDDYVRTTRDVFIPPGEIVDLGEVALEASTLIMGTVTTADGSLVREDELQIVAASAGASGFPDVLIPKTHYWIKTGRFGAGGLRPGAVYVSVCHPRWAARGLRIDVGLDPEFETKLVVEEGLPVTVVRNVDGFGVGDVVVVAQIDGVSLRYPLKFATRTTIALLPGSYALEWQWRGWHRDSAFKVRHLPVTLKIGADLEVANAGH